MRLLPFLDPQPATSGRIPGSFAGDMSPALSKVLEEIRQADLPQFTDVPLDSANVRGGAFGETILHIVAIWGDAAAAGVLIDEGAEIDVQAEQGCTPLHEAALQGHVDVVTLLLSRGADPALRCEFGDFFEIAARSDSEFLRRVATETQNGEPSRRANRRQPPRSL